MSKLAAEFSLVIGVIVAGALVWKLIKGMKAKNWPTVPGSVVDSQITVDYSDDGDPLYGAEVNYRFNVEGLAFSSNRRTFLDSSSNDRGRAEIITSIYAPGTPVQVYYNPEDPEDAVLEPGANSTMAVAWLVPLIFIGIGVAGLMGLM